ncbi:lipoprotein [Listeria monocytogenes]|nr:hypothetical protein [Listeria monocytogenes]EAH0703569.1 hypothetical protein [Listeria monocytogenes]EAH1794657.1 hypothetical protein [Listeria monocytogenes]EJA7861940.1 hypothetical protein [Listeria monocytogenes]
MKKLFSMLFMVILFGSLVACGQSGVDNTKEDKKADNSATVKEDTNKNKEPTDNKENDTKSEDKLVTDGPLLESGQYKIDDQYGSKITLMKIATPKINIDLGDLKMTLQDVKIFKRENVSEDEKNDFSQTDIPITDPYYTIQLIYDIENTSDVPLTTTGFEYIITDQQQQIEASNDYIGGEPYYDVQSGAKLSPEYVVCILKPENVEDIKKITLKTAEVFNSDSYETTAGSKTIEVKFE